MFLGLEAWSVGPTPIGTCRSSGAWLSSAGLMAINMALLTELCRGSHTKDPRKVPARSAPIPAVIIRTFPAYRSVFYPVANLRKYLDKNRLAALTRGDSYRYPESECVLVVTQHGQEVSLEV